MTREQLIGGVLLLIGFGGGVAIQTPRAVSEMVSSGGGELLLNQTYIETVRSQELNLDDPLTVFHYVFRQLPADVFVYPTENYYYFNFSNAGRSIHGNIRLDTALRDLGRVGFAYMWLGDVDPASSTSLSPMSRYLEVGPDVGVQLDRIEPLTYDMTYADRRIRFTLHDVPQTLPDGLALAPGEQFMARTFDESGFQFVLLYNKESPQFYFVLDESALLPDRLQELSSGLWYGQLSRFVFWQDDLGRRVLIGVHTNNVQSNSYFDGPFDQLADNFVRDSRLREAMEAAYPYVSGRINNRGSFIDGRSPETSRLALTPHMHYSSLDELRSFVAQCRVRRADSAAMLLCLTHDEKQGVPAD